MGHSNQACVRTGEGILRLTDRLRVEHGVFLQQLRLLDWLVSEGRPDPILRAVALTITEAEEKHSRSEERLLHPALTRILGAESPALVATRDEHDELRGLATLIRAGSADKAMIERFSTVLRSHLEAEIHGLFPLAEQYLTDEELSSMTNWHVEHVLDEAGRPDLGSSTG